MDTRQILKDIEELEESFYGSEEDDFEGGVFEENYECAEWARDNMDTIFSMVRDLAKEVERLSNKEEEKNYKQMAKSFIGEAMMDFFCNGFFGSRTYDLEGAEITKVYDNDNDNAIVIEVRKMNGRYDYGYFEDGWRDWKCVYEHLDEWVNGNRYE